MAKRRKKQNRKVLIPVIITTLLIFFGIFFLKQISKPQLEPGEAAPAEETTSFNSETETEAEGVIIKFKESKKSAEDKFLNQYATKKPKKISARTYALSTDKNRIEEKVNEFQNREEVEYVEPDYIYHYDFTPNDPLFKNEWWLKKIDAEKAWELTKGNNTILVGIIDSGITTNHPDLAQKVSEWQNFFNDSSEDVVGHGSNLAGIIGALTNNNLGIASLGYNTKIVSIKVGEKKGVRISSAAEGIRWAADHNIKIINLSWGASKGSETLKEAIDYAWNKGVFIVASAGNDKSSKAPYPAGYSNVFSVAATNTNDTKASFSNYGSWVDIAAPGVNVLTTTKSGSYESVSGTSFSAPIVAAMAALLKAKYPNMTNAQLAERICATADKIENTGHFWRCGRVNAYQALAGTGSASPQPITSPLPTTEPNAPGSLNFKLRFQGITQKAAGQKIEIEAFQNGQIVYEKEFADVQNNSDGIYLLSFDNSQNLIPSGRYTIRIKGESHLGKKFENIDVPQTGTVDLSGQEIKAGDVNNDNEITIADIAQILSFYTSFSIPVDSQNQKMTAADINKDKKITIIDIAITALNWSNLTVSGE